MDRIATRFDIRVGVAHLVLAAIVFAAPSQASGLRTPFADAGSATMHPVAAVEVENTSSAAGRTASAFDASAWTGSAKGHVDPKVFALALGAAAAAVERGDADPATLTVIDFSRPSTARRLWVYDLRSRGLLFEEPVSHGRNSGHNLATLFSNDPESNKSSLGLFRAAEGYTGKHGYSLRLDGLEPGINDRARERAIVIHGADYVDLAAAQAQGRLGRSLGCPAVRPEIAASLIDAVKDGGLVFAYYPDAEWLASSRYLISS
jgi:L,D-transpeptidase catalytic domain